MSPDQLGTAFDLYAEKKGIHTHMKLDINDATEHMGRDVITEREWEIVKVLQVSLREVHNNASFLRQRDHWTRTRVPQLQANRGSRGRGTTRAGAGGVSRRRRFIVLGGVEID